jgi:hypothetical protein
MEVLFITPPCLVQFWHEVRCSHMPQFLITHNVGSLERPCIKMILLLATTLTQRSVVWHKTAGSFIHTYYIFTLVISSQIQELRWVPIFNSHTFFLRLNHRFNVCALLCLILYAGDTVPNDAQGNNYLSLLLPYFLFNFVCVYNGSDGDTASYSVISKRTSTRNKAVGAWNWPVTIRGYNTQNYTSPSHPEFLMAAWCAHGPISMPLLQDTVATLVSYISLPLKNLP